MRKAKDITVAPYSTFADKWRIRFQDFLRVDRDGTDRRPFTGAEGMSIAKVGDTVWFKPGTYTMGKPKEFEFRGYKDTN